MSEKIGHPLPIKVRVNTVSVTERMPKILGSVIGHASGLLTMKQSANGTTLIGGGWQGRDRGPKWASGREPIGLSLSSKPANRRFEVCAVKTW